MIKEAKEVQTIVRFLMIGGSIGSLLSFGLALLYGFSGHYFEATYHAIATTLPPLVFFRYRRNGNLDQAIFLFTLIVIYVGVFFIFFAGNEGESVVFLQVLPVFLFFILGRQRATFVLAWFWLLILLSIIIKLIEPQSVSISLTMLISSFAAYTFIFVMLVFYVKRYDDSLDMVKDEMEKNNQKDQQILKQSRLAMMGEMISMIAHQWRQPLTVINSSMIGLELKLENGNLDKELMKKKLHEMEEHIMMLSDTINDFQNFYKPDKDRTFFVLSEAMDRSLRITFGEQVADDIKLERDYEYEGEYFGFKNELMHVLVNLLKNVKDAYDDGDHDILQIKTSILNHDAEIYIEIEDDAGGIPEDLVGRIFDPYFSTKSKNGTGLGLYMSKMIVEEHCKGKIEVSNTDKGALFRIILSKNNQ